MPVGKQSHQKKKKRKAFLLIFTRPAETCQVAFSPRASIGPRESPAEGPRLCRRRTRPPSRLLCGGTRHANCQVPLKATRPRDWPRQWPPEQTVPKAREPPTPGPGLCRRHPQPRGDTDTARWWHGRAGSVVATLHREPAPGALHVGVFIPGVRAPDSVASPVGGISRGWGAAAEWQAPSQAVWNRGEGSGEATWPSTEPRQTESLPGGGGGPRGLGVGWTVLPRAALCYFCSPWSMFIHVTWALKRLQLQKRASRVYFQTLRKHKGAPAPAFSEGPSCQRSQPPASPPLWAPHSLDRRPRARLREGARLPLMLWGPRSLLAGARPLLCSSEAPLGDRVPCD